MAAEARRRFGLLTLGRRYFGFLVAVAVTVVAVLYIPPISGNSSANSRSTGNLSSNTGSTSRGSTQFGNPQGELTPSIYGSSSGLNSKANGAKTVDGTPCLAGARQVDWSKYAPLCLAAYHANNGGATSPGVTGSTITITYREATTSEEQALYSSVAPSVVGSNASVVATMNQYIKVFNRSFELYGRHVVLKPFSGQGDFLQEDEGFDQVQAQADAITAHSIGAFGDVSILASTQPYDQSLASEHVISIGAIAMPQSWFAGLAPYAYSPWADCNKSALTSAIVIGKAMAGMPAIYAGDPLLQSKLRDFGVVYPQIPTYSGCARQAVQQAESQYGVQFNPQDIDPLQLDLSSLSQQASIIVARWKQDGVTSVLCACDPLSPIYLAAAADAQNYHPEWFSFSFGDAFGRLPSQDQWAHAISGGFQSLPKDQQEAYQVYKMVDPKGTPDPSYYYIYAPLLQLFDALQAAGPNLNPKTFEAGMEALPTSLPGGMYGQWVFGKNVYDPPNSFGITWWDPQSVSVQDNKKGSWNSCNSGRSYLVSDGASTLPVHTQLACFGFSPP
ncbi:MAG TPA: hypothetical protein VMU77_07575 [Acidimicrobiales bacterium]|nr:hypothetical protein [Acidimicrobiales bacterium]